MIGPIGARRLAAAVAVCLLAGCVDQDPFALSERPVAGRVALEQWEDFETYYLVTPERHDGGGLIDGTVQRIGWSGRYVVAFRKPTVGGDGEGWMIVDSRLGTVTGPYPNLDLPRLAELHGIRTMPPAEAWDRLPTHAWRLWVFLAALALIVAAGYRRRRRVWAWLAGPAVAPGS